MKKPFKRTLAATVATAIVAAVPLLSATPAFAAPTASGPAVLKTNNNGGLLTAVTDANDPWTMRLDAGNYVDGPDGDPDGGGPLTGLEPDVNGSCQSDGNNGGRAHTYIIPSTESPADLVFNGNGSMVGASAGTGGTGTFRNNLFTTGGSPARTIGLNTVDATIINIPNFSFNTQTNGQIPSGSYNVGIACLDLDEPIPTTTTYGPNNYFNALITVAYPGGDAAGAQILFVPGTGSVPDAPTVAANGVTSGDGTLTVAFTPAASVPATTGFTATATPTGGGTPVTETGSASAITIGGLTNGVSYDVTVHATNTIGDGPESTPVRTGTPNPARPAVTNLAGTPTTEAGEALVNWDYAGPTTNGYSVVVFVSGDVTEAPVGTVGTVDTVNTEVLVSDLTAGTLYQAKVTPTYAGPPVGTSATSADFTVNSAQSLQQHLEVTRPVGALVLTQVCGVYGELAPDTTNTPGFLTGYDAGDLAEDLVGTDPSTEWDEGLATGAEGSAPDPTAGGYPYPVDANGDPVEPEYPTHCGVQLSKAKLITSGVGRGQFFSAFGRLNQITVVSTHDGNEPWTVNGDMEDLFTGQTPGNQFSGNHLGWVPQVTDKSEPFDSDLDGTIDYTFGVIPGNPVAPRTILAGGLVAGQALAFVPDTGPTTAASGIAKFDARLKLLIPVNAINDLYEGTLTFTVI